MQLYSYNRSFISFILNILFIKQNLIIRSYSLFLGSEYEALSSNSSNSFSDSSKAIPKSIIVSLLGWYSLLLLILENNLLSICTLLYTSESFKFLLSINLNNKVWKSLYWLFSSI